MKKIVWTIALATICFAGGLMAQVPPPGGPGTGGPIDGGAVALVAGAALYGYKKLKDKNRQRDNENTN